MLMPFHDRREAGRALGAALVRHFGGKPAGAVVLALPRGGVPVGFEVARILGAPLDVFVVRKLGLPRYPEMAMGAIASGGTTVLIDDIVRAYRVSLPELRAVALAEQRELDRRERAYRGGRQPHDVRGRTVILVDDGLATGATMSAAVAALRKAGAGRIVVGVPVAAFDACEALRKAAGECVCVLTPDPLYGVGAWYRDFSQTTDEEVQALLDAAARARVAAAEHDLTPA